MPVKTDVGSEYYVKGVMDWRNMVDEAMVDAKLSINDKFTEYRAPGDPRTQAHQTVYTAIIEYRSQISTYQDEFEQMWGHPFGALSDGTDVSLSNLRELDEQVFGEHEVMERTSQIGKVSKTEPAKRYRFLPLILCETARDQLNACVREMGLMPQWEPSYEDGHLL